MSDHDCTSDYKPLLQIEQFSDGISTAAGIITWLAESGKAGRAVHYTLEGFEQFSTVCAWEDALIDTRQNKDWTFVMGSIEGDNETRGWLTYYDEVVLPYGPERKRGGSDIGVWNADDFEELGVTIKAHAPAADDSGIQLNAQVRMAAAIDEILGGSA